eukprot:gene16684-19831_t
MNSLLSLVLLLLALASSSVYGICLRITSPTGGYVISSGNGEAICFPNQFGPLAANYTLNIKTINNDDFVTNQPGDTLASNPVTFNVPFGYQPMMIIQCNNNAEGCQIEVSGNICLTSMSSRLVTSFSLIVIGGYDYYGVRAFNVSSQNLYVTTDFDQYKQCKSDVKTSTREGSAKWSTRFDFQYETKYIHKLGVKQFTLCLYKKKSIGSDSLVGQVSVDLYTLATGPVVHDLLLVAKGSLGVGRVQFRLEMVHITKLRINIDNFALSNLHNSLTSHHGDCTNYIEYSLNLNNTLKTPSIQGSLCPTWKSMIPITQKISLKDLVDSTIHFVFKQQKALKDTVVGHLKIPVINIFQFIEGDTKIMRSALLDLDNVKIADVQVTIQFNEIPQFAQLKDGQHTETGIHNAQPYFSGTSWTNPLVAAPVEKKTSSFLGNSASGGGGGNRPVRTKEEQAAILIQRTFRRHKKESYQKTVRKPSPTASPNVRPMLPAGWEASCYSSTLTNPI